MIFSLLEGSWKNVNLERYTKDICYHHVDCVSSPMPYLSIINKVNIQYRNKPNNYFCRFSFLNVFLGISYSNVPFKWLSGTPIQCSDNKYNLCIISVKYTFGAPCCFKLRQKEIKIFIL